MNGITLDFNQQVETGKDELNNPQFETVVTSVDDCLIAPITEPSNAREQQAMHQSIDQVRIHLPKAFTGDVSGSYVVWDGRRFHLDSDSVKFMAENTPTRWDRYLRAESVGQFEEGS